MSGHILINFTYLSGNLRQNISNYGLTLVKSVLVFIIFSSGSSVILWAGTKNIPYETSITFLEAVNELRI